MENLKIKEEDYLKICLITKTEFDKVIFKFTKWEKNEINILKINLIHIVYRNFCIKEIKEGDYMYINIYDVGYNGELHLCLILKLLGFSEEQIKELEEIIKNHFERFKEELKKI